MSKDITAKDYNIEKRKRDNGLWSNMNDEKWQKERKRIQRLVKEHYAELKNE